ncbi:hypothetical protein EV363DRAFT_1394400 [Boletus edulis]|nr:hypothetical protein EV363DRAFT_1394400 [Boletus edulis]
MKFPLSWGRSPSIKVKYPDPQPYMADPPPYTSVVSPESHMNMNGAPRTGRSSAAAGSSSAFEPFSSSRRLRDIAYLQAPMRQDSKENALDTLRTYDTVVIMDDSGSMQIDGRWEQIAATYDRDGIDIHFLNHPTCGMNIKDPKDEGPTPIANKLDLLVGDYVNKLERAGRRKQRGDELALRQIKPVNFIVITDGVPTDEPMDSIVSLARRLDHEHVGIQFVQIGNDKEATEFLKQLDDDLSGIFGVRDIVDTTPYLGTHLTATMLIKILLGGINRRVDRRGGEAVMSK